MKEPWLVRLHFINPMPSCLLNVEFSVDFQFSKTSGEVVLENICETQYLMGEVFFSLWAFVLF